LCQQRGDRDTEDRRHHRRCHEASVPLRMLHTIPKLVGATVHVSPSNEGGDPHAVLAHHHVSPLD
jgi:hypothetical protein